MKEVFAPLYNLYLAEKVDLKALIQAHLQVAEALAATDTKAGALNLWKGDAGEAAAHFFADLLEKAEPHSVCVIPKAHRSVSRACGGGSLCRPDARI